MRHGATCYLQDIRTIYKIVKLRLHYGDSFKIKRSEFGLNPTKIVHITVKWALLLEWPLYVKYNLPRIAPWPNSQFFSGSCLLPEVRNISVTISYRVAVIISLF